MKGTFGFLDPIYMQTGVFTVASDAYAMGVTMLICLTGKDALHAMRSCQDLLEEPSLAATHSDSTAVWPSDATTTRLAELIQGLCTGSRPSKRLPFAKAVAALEELVKRIGVGGRGERRAAGGVGAGGRARGGGGRNRAVADRRVGE